MAVHVAENSWYITGSKRRVVEKNENIIHGERQLLLDKIPQIVTGSAWMKHRKTQLIYDSTLYTT